jgi:signal peptidase I
VTVATVVVLVLGWLLLGPASMGGSTTWLVPHGSSMHPLLTQGDLAVLRPAAGYDVGDVVGYRSTVLNTTVLHRIVARDGDRFITEGDANTWRDPDRIAPEQILGTLWFHIPGGGLVIGVLRDPWVLVALGLVVLALGGWAAARTTRPPRRRIPSAAAPRLQPSPAQMGQAAVAAAVLAAGVGWLALSQPAVADTTRGLSYRHAATLSYTAAVPASGIYNGNQLHTGDPIFLALTPAIQAEYIYTADSHLTNLSGTVTPTIEVSAGNGWRRTLQIAPAHRFTGSRATVSTPVDIIAANQAVRQAEQRSGVSLGTYTLDLVFHTAVRGQLDGHPAEDTYSPRMSFTVDGHQAVLAQRGEAAAPIQIDQERNLVVPDRSPAQTTIGRWKVDIAVLRLLAVTLGLIAAALGVWWWRHRHVRDTDPTALFGSRLLQSHNVDFRDWPVIDVADLLTLGRLAERHDVPVVYQPHSYRSAYYVEVGGVVYRHLTTAWVTDKEVVG